MKIIRTLAAAAALTLCATGASADIMSATYKGVLYAGTDLEGVFAAPGTDLTGAAFEYNFVYDTAVGAVTPYIGGQALVSGSSQPVLSATLTILGQTYSPSGLNGYYSMAANIVADIGDPAYGYKGSACHFAGAAAGSWFAVCINSDDVLPDNLGTPFTTTAAAPPTFGGFADAALPSDNGVPFNQYLLYGNPATLEVVKLRDSPAAVPEPATWALMILGFGGVGAALRGPRRRPLVV